MKLQVLIRASGPDAVPALFRAEGLEEGELHVGPGADLFADDVEVALAVDAVDESRAVLVHRAQHAVVQVQRAVVLAHERQVVGVEGAEGDELDEVLAS